VERCASSSLALQRITLGERFDVVLCDGRMPALDWANFFARACAAWPAIRQRLVFVTGRLQEETRAFASRNELPEFTKPLERRDRDDLVLLVRAIAYHERRRGTGASESDDE
jgi:CheY-like chemotaxis protein